MKRRIGDLRSSPALGGRRAAEQRLAAIDPARYAASRNHLDGAVTRLSPYIRHGVLTLAEVREAVFARLGGSSEAQAVRQGELFPSQPPARRASRMARVRMHGTWHAAGLGSTSRARVRARTRAHTHVCA